MCVCPPALLAPLLFCFSANVNGNAKGGRRGLFGQQVDKFSFTALLSILFLSLLLILALLAILGEKKTLGNLGH